MTVMYIAYFPSTYLTSLDIHGAEGGALLPLLLVTEITLSCSPWAIAEHVEAETGGLSSTTVFSTG